MVKKIIRQGLIKLIVPSIAITSMGYSGVTVAQEDNILEEILVTARKREENLQEIPETVVALTSETVERANIEMVRDVTAAIPNVSIEESLSPNSTFIGVRGIVSTRNGEPAVAMVVDGIQIGSAAEVSQAFSDVEQIELLKGPQGALYGRNAIGGALILTTKKPSNEPSANVTVGVGDNGWFEASGAVSGPITDNLFFRLSANLKDFDGTIKNEYLAGLLDNNTVIPAFQSDFDSDETYVDFENNKDWRLRLLWEVSENTEVNFHYNRNALEAGSFWYRSIYRLETPGVKYEFPIGNDVNSTAIRELDSLTLKIDHETSFATLTSISGYTSTEERYGVAFEGRGSFQTGDVDFINDQFVAEFGTTRFPEASAADVALLNGQFGQDVGSDQFYDIESWSQEIRLTSPNEGRFRYVAGVYGLWTDRKDTIRADYYNNQGLPLDGTSNTSPDAQGLDGMFPNALLFETSNSQDNFAWALFFNADYDLTEKLTLTAALRYDQDDREVTRISGPTVDDGGATGALLQTCTADGITCVASGTVERETFSAFQPKFSLAYLTSDNLTLYGTYARGFRSGGFNGTNALLAETYDKELLDSYELGFKSTLMNGSLRLNGAAFYQDWDNAQVFEFDGQVFVQSLYNIPKSEIYGVEMSFDWLLTNSLTISGGVGIMASEIIKFDADIRDRLETQINARFSNTVKLTPDVKAEFDSNFEGNKLVKFPHQTANLALIYELPLNAFSGSTLITRIDYNVRGKRYWWIDNTDKEGYEHFVNASVSLDLGENWDIQGWCKNCFDRESLSAYEPAEMVLFGGAALDVAYEARRRTYGVKVNYTF